GEQMPFQQAGIAIGNEPRRARRLAIDKARRAVLGTPSAMRRDRLDCERDMLGTLLGLDVVAARSRLSGIDLHQLAAQCSTFLEQTADLYRDSLARRLRAELGLAPGDADRTDGSWLFRGASYDEFFPADALAATARRQVAEMGLDAEAGGRIIYDTADRERKR